MYKEGLPVDLFGYEQVGFPRLNLDTNELSYNSKEENEYDDRQVQDRIDYMSRLHGGKALPVAPTFENDASEEDIAKGMVKQLFGVDMDNKLYGFDITKDKAAYDNAMRPTKGRSEFVGLLHEALNDEEYPTLLIPEWDDKAREWRVGEALPLDETFEQNYEYAKSKFLNNVRKGLFGGETPHGLDREDAYRVWRDRPLEEGETDINPRYGNPENYDAAQELWDAGAVYGEYLKMNSRRAVPVKPVIENGKRKFIKTDKESMDKYFAQAEKEGLDVKDVMALRTKGVKMPDGNVYPIGLSFEFVPGEEDETINKLLKKGEVNNGIISYEDALELGYTKDDIKNAIAKKATLQESKLNDFNDEMARKGPVGVGEYFGLSNTYTGQSLSEMNEGKGVGEQVFNFVNAKLNPISSHLQAGGSALARLYGGDEEGAAKLKGKGGLSSWEQIQSGIYTDDVDTQIAMLQERAKAEAKRQSELSARDTTFWADAAMAAVDSTRLMSEIALVNTLAPGSGVAKAIGSTALYSAAYADEKYKSNIANMYAYNPANDSLALTKKGMGEIEALVKGTASGALEYLGEMFTVQALSAIGKTALKPLKIKLLPSQTMRMGDDIARASGKIGAARVADSVISSPSPGILTKIKNITGRDLSLKGVIHESFTEEAFPAAVSAFFNLENQASGEGRFNDAWGAFVDATKMAPAMAVGVAVQSAAAGMLARGASGFYNTGATKKDLVEALVGIGESREILEKMDKVELNDLFYKKMSKMKNIYSKERLDNLTEEELNEQIRKMGIVADGISIENLSHDLKKEMLNNYINEAGGNILMDEAIHRITNAAIKTVLANQDHSSILRSLDVDILDTGDALQNFLHFNENDRVLMQQIVLLRSLAGSRLYHGNVFGYACEAQANMLAMQLGESARTALGDFEANYSTCDVDFHNPNKEGRAASTFAFRPEEMHLPNGKSSAIYTDNDSGIEIRAERTPTGKVEYRVVPAEKTGYNEFDMALAEMGMQPRKMTLPHGEATYFDTIEGAVDFANKLSSWHNTATMRLVNKAQLAQRAFQHFRGQDARVEVVEDAWSLPEDVQKEVIDDFLVAKNGDEGKAFDSFEKLDGYTSSDGRVFLVMNNIDDVYQIELLAKHEATHQGLKDIFGNSSELVQEAMLELASSPNLPKEFHDIDVTDPIAVEERLADLAEILNEEPGLWETIRGAFKRASLATAELGKEISDANIHKIIHNAWNARFMQAMENPPRAEEEATETAQEEAQTEAPSNDTPKAKESAKTPVGETLNPQNAARDAKRKAAMPEVPVDGETPVDEVKPETQTTTTNGRIVIDTEPQAPKAATQPQQATSSVSTPSATQPTKHPPLPPQQVIKLARPSANETAKTEPQAPKAKDEAPKQKALKQEAPTQTNTPQDKEQVEVLELGGDYIAEGTFKSVGLKELNGIEDIKTEEAQEKILSDAMVEYAQAALVRASNSMRSAGFDVTDEAEALLAEFHEYAGVIIDLPASEKKREVFRKLMNMRQSFLQEMERVKKLNKTIKAGSTSEATTIEAVKMVSNVAQKTEEPKAKAKTPKVEKPKVEAKAPKVETPKVEVPKAEAPKVETTQNEQKEKPKLVVKLNVPTETETAPKTEAPKAEVPKAEAKKEQEPKDRVDIQLPEEIIVEAQKEEAAKKETAKVEAPKVEEPKVETPKAEALSYRENLGTSTVEAPKASFSGEMTEELASAGAELMDLMGEIFGDNAPTAPSKPSAPKGRARVRDGEQSGSTSRLANLSPEQQSRLNIVGAKYMKAYIASAKSPSYEDFVSSLAQLSQSAGESMFDNLSEVSYGMWAQQSFIDRRFKPILPDEAHNVIGKVKQTFFTSNKKNGKIDNNESEDNNGNTGKSNAQNNQHSGTSGTGNVPGQNGVSHSSSTSGDGNKSSAGSSNVSPRLANEQSSNDNGDGSRGDSGRTSTSGNSSNGDGTGYEGGSSSTVRVNVRNDAVSENGAGDSVGSSAQSQGNTSNARGSGSSRTTPKAPKEKAHTVKPTNYVIPEEDDGGIGKEGGLKTRVNNNINALKLLKELEEKGLNATTEEQRTLSLYTGWGNLTQLFDEKNEDFAEERSVVKQILTPEEYASARSTVTDAHYTPIQVIRSMYDAMEILGVNEPNLDALEGGIGIGHFIGSLPQNLRSSNYSGVEIDTLSYRIAKKLYPNSRLINDGFQNFVPQSNGYDFVIGNPPFGNLKLFDKNADYRDMSIHNHFIAKQIDALRPGGVGGFLVTHNFLDAKNNAVRQYIHNKAHFVGAIRLPSATFKTIANTDITCDIVIFRKRMPDETNTDKNREWLNTTTMTRDGLTANINENVRNYNDPDDDDGGFIRFKRGQFSNDIRIELTGKVPTRKGLKEAFDYMLRYTPYKYVSRTDYEKWRKDHGQHHDEIINEQKIADDIRHPSLMVGGFYLDKDGNLCVATASTSEGMLGRKCGKYDAKAEKVAYERNPRVNKNGKAHKFDRWTDVPNAYEKFDEKETEIVKAIVKLRDVRYDLVELELSVDASDEAIENKRKELNEAYDEFFKISNGKYLNSKSIRTLVSTDPAISQVQGLEVSYAATSKGNDGKTIKEHADKAAIFHKRVNYPKPQEPTHFDNVKDATIASINKFGRVNMDWLKQVTGKSEEEILKDFDGFKNPATGEYQTRELYLSGDVKTKLEEAEKFKKENPLDTSIDKNIEALKEVIPADIPVADIVTPLGAPFVPPKAYEIFLTEKIGFTSSQDVNFYLNLQGNWIFSIDKHAEYDDVKAMYQYPRKFSDALEHAFNNKVPKITYKDPVTEKTVVDQAATEMAIATVQKIRDQWDSWWRSNGDVSKLISRNYNDTFNRTVDAHFNGDNLVLEGTSPDIKLYKHQKDAVLRTVMTRRALYNHVVGAGKTFTAIASIMEMKRMGIARKPVVVVPNHLTLQWRDDFLKLYPSANVLAATPDDFNAANRKVFFARIQNGEYDAIIVPHSQLVKLSLSPDILKSLTEDAINEMRVALDEAAQQKSGNEVRRIEDRIKKFEEKMRKRIEATKADKAGIFLDTLGVDCFFLDESHEFKNVPFVASSVSGVAGMGNPGGSIKAFDLLMKMDYFRKYRPSAPTIFLTGTPIANSLTELYLNMRTLAPDVLESAGIRSMDAFLHAFGDITDEFEIDTTGRMKNRRRLRALINVGEVMTLARTYMDVLDSEGLVKSQEYYGARSSLPKVTGGKPTNIVATRSKAQEEYFGIVESRDKTDTGAYVEHWNEGSLAWRAEAVGRGGVDPADDNMLKITSNGLAASLDLRLVDPTAEEHPNGKTQLCADKVVETYKKFNSVKGTQLVFLDTSIPLSAKGQLVKDLAKMKEKYEKVSERYNKAIENQEDIGEILVKIEREDGSESEVTIDEAMTHYEKEIALTEQNINYKFSVYDDLKAKLIKQGIPEKEIAFIHSYNTPSSKQQLFNKMNKGEIRVLIGSTQKMGAGTNVQKLLVALHHLDTPWRPADMEQRNGRIIRPGNSLYNADPDHFTVSIYQYATEQTADSYKYQTLESKGKAFSTIYKANSAVRQIEDFGDGALSAEEMKAAASGSSLILKRVDVEKTYRKLERGERVFYETRNNLRDAVDTGDAEVARKQSTVDRLEEAKSIAQAKPETKDKPYAGVDVVAFDDLVESDKFKNPSMLQSFKSFKERTEAKIPSIFQMITESKVNSNDALPLQINYRGFTWLPVRKMSMVTLNGYPMTEEHINPRKKLALIATTPIQILGNEDFTKHEPDPRILQRLNNTVDNIEKVLGEAVTSLNTEKSSFEANKKQLDALPEVYPQEAELVEARREKVDLDACVINGCRNGEEAYEYLSEQRYKGKEVPDYSWLHDNKSSGTPKGRARVREDDSLKTPPSFDEYAEIRRKARPVSAPRAILNGMKDFLKTQDGESRAEYIVRRAKEALDWLNEAFHDYNAAIRKLQENVAGKNIPEEYDIAKAAQLSFGRVHAEHMKIEHVYSDPIRHLLADNNIEIEDFDIYLTSMFAPERNAMIRERTSYGRKPADETGSGISDEQAKEYIKAIKNKYNAVQFKAIKDAAEKVWELNRATVNNLASAGIISEETARAWLEGSPHYVPLRDDLKRLGLEENSKAHTLGKPFQTAVGRFTESIDSQLAFSLLQAQVTTMLAEQNRINQTALAFCNHYEAPLDKDGTPQWRVSRGPKIRKRVVREEKGFRAVDAIPLDITIDEEAEQLLAYKRLNLTINPDADLENVFWVDPDEATPVLKVKNGKDAGETHKSHNVLVRVDGHPMYIFFNDREGSLGYRVGQAINRANLVEPQGALFRTIKRLTHIKAQMVTRLNPTFALRNMLADANNVMGILAAEGKVKDMGAVVRNYGPALSAVARWKKRGKFGLDGRADKYLEEAVYAGMLTGTHANSTYADNMINEVLRPLKKLQIQKGFGKGASGIDMLAYSGSKLLDIIGALSDIPEVGVRLAVYISLRENGFSKSDAAVYAREVTVDFNKKGRFGPTLNTLYMFSNAGVQGAVRWLTAIKRGGVRHAATAIGAYMLIGFFSAMANDDDDEAWKNMSDWEKQKNIIVPIPGTSKYIRIPNRGVPAIFTYSGMKLYDILYGGESVAEGMKDVLGGPFLDTFSFIGEGAGDTLQAVLPTIFDPVAQLATNTSYHGGSIHTERFPNQTTPRSHMARKNTNAAAVWLAQTLNAMTGGDDVVEGALDFYPEDIAHIAQFFLGGVGQEVAKISDFFTRDMSIKNVPILSGITGDIPTHERRYYEAVQDFGTNYKHVKQYRALGREDDAKKVIKENPYMKAMNELYGFRKGVEKYQRQISKAKEQGREDLVQELTEKMLDYMKRFLIIYDRGKRSK